MTPAKVMVARVTDLPGGNLIISFEIVVFNVSGFLDKFVIDATYTGSTTQQQMRSLIRNAIIADCATRNYSVQSNDIIFGLDS